MPDVLSKEDRNEMRIAATAALGLFPRVEIDPAHLLALLDAADEDPAIAFANDLLTNNPSVGTFSMRSKPDAPEPWIVVFAKGENVEHVEFDPFDDGPACEGCGLPDYACACDDEEEIAPPIPASPSTPEPTP
jgi:GT2 family glycosyltransferase